MKKSSEKGKNPKETYTSSEVKRYMSVLMEHVDDRIIGISEQFVDFGRKLDSHTEMIVALAEDVSVLKDDVSVLKTDMTIVKQDISEIKGDMKHKVDSAEFAVLDRRLTSVEAKA